MAKVGPENAPVNLESEMETIKIEKLTMDHVDKVYQFMIKEYCLDEPVFRLVFLWIWLRLCQAEVIITSVLTDSFDIYPFFDSLQ